MRDVTGAGFASADGRERGREPHDAVGSAGGHPALRLQRRHITDDRAFRSGQHGGNGHSEQCQLAGIHFGRRPGASRSIRGDVVGSLPPGIRLRLDISPYVGTGQGFTGGNSYVTANTYLTNTPTNFIANIKGAYTGITYGSSGFKLNYSLEIQDFANMRSGTTSVTVRYTMVDN